MTDTIYEARWGESAHTIESPDDAEGLVDDAARAYGPDGTRGVLIGIGPQGADPVLEVAMNVDEGRACLTWLADPVGYAAEVGLPAHPRPVRVWAYRDEGPRTILPAKTRLTPGRALAAVREYVTTGLRPTGVLWMPE